MQDNLLITVLFILLLIIDYFVKMNTIYYEFGKAITDRSIIFNRYLKTNFVIDGLSILVLLTSIINNYFFIIETEMDYILLLFLSQHHYFTKVLTNLEESLHLSRLYQSCLNLIKLIMTILLFEHFFSCIWNMIAEFE